MPFVEPQGSLLYLHEPAIGQYHETPSNEIYLRFTSILSSHIRLASPYYTSFRVFRALFAACLLIVLASSTLNMEAVGKFPSEYSILQRPLR